MRVQPSGEQILPNRGSPLGNINPVGESPLGSIYLYKLHNNVVLFDEYILPSREPQFAIYTPQ
jgi:hypothetical protein